MLMFAQVTLVTTSVPEQVVLLSLHVKLKKLICWVALEVH